MTAASADAFPWVDVVVNGKPMRRCDRHDQTFARKATCKACTKSRRAMPKAEKVELPTPPKGCLSSLEIERWYVAMAEASRVSAERIETRPAPQQATPTKAPAKKKGRGKASATAPAPQPVERDFHDEAAIANHRDRAIKAMRAATELATRREDDWIVDQRDERMAGRERGASN